ncbi:hypothetical protein [Aquimarina sp. AU474]|uniref:hypothetical protein n=1 Tax=Aquimarina sp. AU474 TaxID=2108529 RepID=UPI000D68ECB7|nr:hypothetical protein [Aquimarina sp. AU474]
MKTTSKLVSLMLLTTILFSCSAVKVTDSWKDVKTLDIKNKNIMVVSRSDNETLRTRFEKDLVNNLNDQGYQSVESFVVFPGSNPTDEVSEEEMHMIKEKIKKSGIEVAIVTSLKNCQEYTETTTTGVSYQVSTFPFYYRGYYRGFYRYYGTVYMQSDPITIITSKGKVYILETVVYDLTQPEDQQLLSVITTSIDNPETIGVTSKHFSKKITKELTR